MANPSRRRRRTEGRVIHAFYKKAQARPIPTRSKLSKVQLENALGLH